jgi:SAM-dependent methyltransferase
MSDFWDDFYAERDQIWSGRPNAVLAREAAGLTPGTALDLGCGEGADAVWLAQQGWRVVAVDISGVALARAAGHAAAAGVADRIDFQRRDLAESFPDGRFDLVTAQFLPEETVLRAAAEAVAPGGILLIEGHLNDTPGGHRHHEHHGQPVRFPTPQEIVDELGLRSEEWEVHVAAAHERAHSGMDSTVKARRRASGERGRAVASPPGRDGSPRAPAAAPADR